MAVNVPLSTSSRQIPVFLLPWKQPSIFFRINTFVYSIYLIHVQSNVMVSFLYRCGSVTAYLSLNFTRNVKIPVVLSVLKKAAEGNGFGDFQVDPGSVQAISDQQLPTDSPISTQEPTSRTKS